MKKALSLLLTLLMLLSVAYAEPATRTFIDSLGRTVELQASIQRVSVSGPMAEMFCFALCPDKLVGWAVDRAAEAEQYIPETYLQLPILGQLYGGKGELNLESLLLADPDVIIDVGEPRKGAKADLDALQAQTGIPFVHITATTAHMGDAFRTLGDLTGDQEAAGVLGTYCDETYARTLSIMEQVGDNKVSILYLLGDDGLNVIAKGAYPAEVIDLMGDNAAVVDEPSAKGTGNESDLEQLLLWNPEAIFFAPDSVFDQVGTDANWQQLSAIREGRYYEVPFGPHNWMGFPPSVQRYLGMMWMGKLLYPEYATYDLEEEVARYYSLFYHTDLSHEQYLNLVGEI